MTINQLHNILKRAGLERSRYTASGSIRGYGWWSPGYRISERKESNPEWMGLGFRKHLPKFLPTGIYEITHTESIEKVRVALKQAGISFQTENQKVIVDGNNQ